MGVSDYLREGSDALRRVPDVPHFDVRGRDCEYQARVAGVLYGDYIVRMTFQRGNFLASDQVPHFAAPILKKRKGKKEKKMLQLYQC